jgi:hypothetical protein
MSGLAVAFLFGTSATVFGDLAPPIGKRPVGPGVGPGVRPVVLPAFKPQKVKFSVEVDEKGKEVRLLVPIQFMLGGLGGGIGGPIVPGGGFGVLGGPGVVPPGGGFTGIVPPGVFPPGVVPPGVVPPGTVPPGVTPPKGTPTQGNPKGTAPRADASELRLPTIMAGLALTAAFVSGGLWMVRRGAGRTLIGLLVVSTFVAGAALLWADARVPFPNPRPFTLPDVPKGTPIKLPASVELNDKISLEILPAGDTIRLLVPKSVVKDADK